MTMIIDDLRMLAIGQLIQVPAPDGTEMMLSRVYCVFDPDSPPIWQMPDYLIYASPDNMAFSDYYALDEIFGGICEHCGGNLAIGQHSTTVDGYCDDRSNDDLPF